MSNNYYLIQGIVKEICPVERYGYTFRNLMVDGILIHMAKGATWTNPDTQVGDEVAVTCIDQYTSEGKAVTGVTVTWIGGRRRKEA